MAFRLQSRLFANNGFVMISSREAFAMSEDSWWSSRTETSREVWCRARDLP